DQWADDKGLPTFGDLVGYGDIGFFAIGTRAPARDNFLATRKKLINDRDIQVTIQGQGQRAWDGCGRHNQHMGVIAFLAQGIALFYAEAVLLINDDQSKTLKR